MIICSCPSRCASGSGPSVFDPPSPFIITISPAFLFFPIPFCSVLSFSLLLILFFVLLGCGIDLDPLLSPFFMPLSSSHSFSISFSTFFPLFSFSLGYSSWLDSAEIAEPDRKNNGRWCILSHVNGVLYFFFLCVFLLFLFFSFLLFLFSCIGVFLFFFCVCFCPILSLHIFFSSLFLYLVLFSLLSTKSIFYTTIILLRALSTRRFL